MLHSEQRLFFRPGRRASLPLPFAVRSVGHYRLEPGWSAAPREARTFFQWFWVVGGRGRVFLGNRARIATAGHVFFYPPGSVHRLEHIEGVWDYRWLTLDARFSARWVALLPDRGSLWSAGQCPQETFEELTEAVRDPTPAGERRASALAYRILLGAYFGELSSAPARSLAGQARDWLLLHHDDPAATVEALAEHCRVHRSTLFRTFTAAWGIGPAEYLRRLRVQRGVRLLRETNLPITEVARRSGFPDPNYFARAIRREKGVPPRDVRRGGAAAP